VDVPIPRTDVPAELISDYDILDPTLAVPFDRLAELREKCPVSYVPRYEGYWLVTRYADVRRVVTEWETFSNRSTTIPYFVAGGLDDGTIPLETDPPDHTHYRAILNPLFSPGRMKALGDQIRARAIELLDAFAGRGECDFIAEFAHPLPSSMFVALMGWPAEDSADFARWTDEILVGNPGGTPEEDMAVRQNANEAAQNYFRQSIAERRRSPVEGDFTNVLLEAKFADERPLTDSELVRALRLLMLGGLHTVRASLGFGMIHLARNPEQRQRLIDDPSLIPTAVEEILRMDAPVTTARVVAKPVRLGDAEMLPGDKVLVSLPSAGYDPAEFECPTEFKVDRNPNRHLTFSAGPHRCVGSNLARVELSIAFEEILRRIPDFEVVAEPARHHTQVRGLFELPIRFTPTAS
jgi:cytochrome P450